MHCATVLEDLSSDSQEDSEEEERAAEEKRKKRILHKTGTGRGKSKRNTCGYIIQQ